MNVSYHTIVDHCSHNTAFLPRNVNIVDRNVSFSMCVCYRSVELRIHLREGGLALRVAESIVLTVRLGIEDPFGVC